MGTVVTDAERVEAAARASNLSEAAAGEAVNAVFDAITANVARGGRVTVVGFGPFVPRKMRLGRDPPKGWEIRIDAKTVPAFAGGQLFENRVAGRKAAWLRFRRTFEGL